MSSSSAPTPEHARLSELFTALNGSSQTLYGGFVNASGDAAQVQLVWGKKDLINNATHKYHVQYQVNDVADETKSAVHRGIFPSSWDVAATTVSPSKQLVVTLKLEKGSDAAGPAEGVFSVYKDSTLIHTFRTPKSAHGAIYLGEREGGLVWSHDETRIAYVAEKKSAESAPFWENVNSSKAKDDKKATDDDSKKSDDAVLPGNKYVHEDDWGEQYVGKKTGAIFVATLATGKIDEVKGVPANLTCADVQFTPGDDGLIFAGTETASPKRLGIIYCYNRPITLYHLPFSNTEDVSKNEATATKIKLIPTDEGSKLIASMRSPRFSPDGKKVAFYATRDVSTHNTCSILAVLDWETKHVSTLIDIVNEPQSEYTTSPATAFNGLFTGSLSKKAWSSDGKFLFFDTQVGTRFLWKYVDVATKQVVSPAYVEGHTQNVGIETVLDRDGDAFLVSVSSPIRPSSVHLISLDLATGKYKRAPIVIEDQSRTSQYIKEWKVFAIPTEVSDTPAALKKLPEIPEALKEHLIPSTTSKSDYEATVLLPASEAPADGYPVIMDLHGGPHGNSPAMYRVLYEYFAALGFAVVSVNYRGSTGYGLNPLESLVGKVGTQDIYDCHYALQHLLSTSGLPLDKAKVHCSGGSHGGFIVGHLIGQFPGFYRSTVSRNPVSNIASMFYATDIPDWTLAATGVQRFESITSSQKLQHSHAELPALTPEVRLAILAKFWQHSPVSNDLSKVSTPVLFGIGGKDRRVPPPQGLELRDSLSAYGVETRTLWYPEDCHPLDTLQAYGDFAVNWALWVTQHN
uniref:Acylamino-acid-releasing enzyme n=2 Tax=Globisporangium ultimum (strain ATCC 200006 / CBS 805.95 / DAOM BR144) TaxID=431595 RepID=K3XAI9_GLOUD